MKVMHEQLLIDETLERATRRACSMLGLLNASFSDGAALARKLAYEQGLTIDPVATCFFEEAHRLLFSTRPDFAKALVALELAEELEPICYGRTYVGLRKLVITGARDAVLAELSTTRALDPCA